ncbi:MAG: phosphonoacetaldehyde reductase [bacterium]|nr:phosphonoacetaldehyde reductase [bacterium]
MPLSKISNLSENTLSGANSLAQLESLTTNFKNILLFADKNGFEPCGAAAFFEEFQNKTGKSIKRILYAGKALPIDDIENIYRDCRSSDKDETGADAIIAVGGGTVIDLAKIIAVAISNTCQNAEEVLDNKSLENRIPLIFVPTTAGTGSETTSFAVVYRDKIKISIERKSLLPETIILDPLLLKSLPVPILNATVLDALAQATESVWAAGSTDESQIYSAKAILLIMDNIDKKNSIERLSRLQQASYWAGKAINVSKTTLPHSISYPITSHFGVSHGIAVFLTLPEVARLNYSTSQVNKQDHIQLNHIEKSFALLFSLYGTETIEQLVEKLKGVLESLHVKNRLRDYSIAESDLDFLASNALTKGRSDNNPRKMTIEEVLALLKRIY